MLRDVTFGRRKRVIVNIPPQHGKSTLIAHYFPAYFFAFWPFGKIIYVSYEAEYAASWSAKARETVREHGPTMWPGQPIEIDPNQDRRDWWGIKGYGGYLVSAGAGGPITGKGADILIIDDPHKNAAEANSPTIQEAIFDWYKSTAYTRLSPEGAVILIQTRWNSKDLTGRLLEAARQGEGDEWDVIDLPAIATDANDLLGRAVGDPLWPEGGWTTPRYNRVKTTMGHYWFNALYQQKPVPAGGGVFKKEYFRYARDEGPYLVLENADWAEREKRVPKSLCRCIQTVDLASSVKSSADYFVIETWLITPWNDLVLWDVVRTRVEGPDQLPLIWTNFRRWNAGVIGIEKVAYQQTMLQSAVRAGLPAVALEADSDKFSRALGIAARYEAHAVYHRHGMPGLDVYETELLQFNPAAKDQKDDQVDCAAYAARFLLEQGGPVGVSAKVQPARRYGL